MNRLLKTGTLFVLAALAAGTVWLASKRAAESGPTARTEEKPGVRHESQSVPDAASRRWRTMVDASISLQNRMAVAQSIRPGLAAGEVDELFDLMNLPAAPHDRENWWLIVNEIMEQMRKNGVGAESYSDRLCLLIEDGSADDVIRDYAIQHLLQWISTPVELNVPGETNETNQEKSLQTVVKVIQRAESCECTISGTGLLALVDASGRLSENQVTSLWKDLDDFLANAIKGKIPTETHLQASAIQAASRMRRSAHLPLIRSLVTAGGIDPSVRLSSIHALGVFGDPSDRPLLERLSSLDSPFQYAARSALQLSSSPSQP